MSAPSTAVIIRDCGPRDGLQGESPLDVDVRLRLACDLASAGVRDIEAAAFVSPRAVPSMAGAAEIVAQLPDDGTNWWVLVPNRRGSVFSLCERSKSDPRFAKYPPIPVRECPGYEKRDNSE